MQRKRSIKKISGFLPLLILVLIMINIITVSITGIIYLNVRKDEQQSADYFKKFNNFVLMVLDSGGETSGELSAEHSMLSGLFSSLSRRLRSKAELPPPGFGSEDERNVYSSQLRENASVIRDNLSEEIRISYRWISVLIIISLSAGLVLMFFMFRERADLVEYGKKMSEGIEYLEKLVRFERLP